MVTHPFAGARKMKPTQKHRPAIWEAMLGTVYACNDEGQVRYFDYDWDAAREFAGVAPERDLRVWRQDHTVRVGRSDERLVKGRKALYIKRA